MNVEEVLNLNTPCRSEVRHTSKEVLLSSSHDRDQDTGRLRCDLHCARHTGERQAFRVIHGAFMSSMVLNPALVRQLHSLHDHVLEKLSVEQLTQGGDVLPEEAAAQIAFLQNARDNDMLASFMALAQVSPSMRSVLADMKAPIGAELKWGSVDDAVTSVSSGMMSLLTRATLEKPGRLGSIGKELDRLSGLLSAVETENRLLTSFNQISDKVEASNDYASKYLDKGSKMASDFMSRRQAQAKTKAGKIGFNALGFIAAMGSKEASAARGESLTSFLNNIEGWDTVRSALHDLRGATETNIPLLRLINQVKAKVDALRQDFREGVPKTLAKQFSRKLSRQEWSALHTVMGTTDIMALGLTEARALLKDPASLAGRITAAEETVAGLSRPLADRYRLKAKALAIYMVKGEVTSEHLLRNARAIAHLFGEGDRPDPTAVGDDLIQSMVLPTRV